jgi:hypothetical protein
MSATDLRQFLTQFQDYLAPKLDTYEQAVYLYCFRKSRLDEIEEVTIGFKSARHRLATGIGESGKAMSESTAYLKLATLESKGCITVVRTNHKGRVIRLHLPSEIPGIVPVHVPEKSLDIEDMDFFNVAENRNLLLKREQFKCFYTRQNLDKDNFIVEHVVSRPVGDNSYRNCVAASRETNNKKGSVSAEDYVRRLFRDGFLSESEFEDRLSALVQLKAGHLKPPLN